MDKKIKETTFSALAIRDALYFLTVALNLQKSKSKVKRPYFMSQLPELVTNQPEAGYDVLILPNPPPPPTPCLPPTTLRFKGTFKKLLKATRKEKTGRYKFGKKIATSRRQGDVLVYCTDLCSRNFRVFLSFSSLFPWHIAELTFSLLFT